MTKLDTINGEHRRRRRIEVVCGSMFSGKTEELICRMKRAQFAKQKVGIFKSSKVHAICVKCGSLAYVSHRLVNDEKRVLLGETAEYEPLCSYCY